MNTFRLAFLLVLLSFAHGFCQSVTVTAEGGWDDSITQQYIALDQECRRLISAHEDAVVACKKVSDEADHYAPNSHYITKRGAYVFYATALIRAKKPSEAVIAADKAVQVVLIGHDDASGSSAAYGVRGQAKAFTGDLNGADADLNRAEIFLRQGLDSPAGQSLHFEYAGRLKSLFVFHAQVLSALHKDAEADLKTREAGKL